MTRDIPYYNFFALDSKYDGDSTKILFALEEDRIDGMMLVYGRSIVQLRGGCEDANVLSDRLDLERVELQALKEHKQYVLEKYKPTVSHEMVLMVLHKGREGLQLIHPIPKLDASDADRITTIMKDADAEF